MISDVEAAARLGMTCDVLQRALRASARGENPLRGVRVPGGRGGQHWLVDEESLGPYREWRAEWHRRATETMCARFRQMRREDGHRCPRCEVLTADGGLCEQCRRELAGVPYWAGMDVQPMVGCSMGWIGTWRE